MRCRDACRLRRVVEVLSAVLVLSGATLDAADAAPAAPAADVAGPITLTVEQEAVLARAFAPTLVFHPLETYFPTNPMRPVEPDAVDPGHSSNKSTAKRASGLEGWRARVERYRALSSAEKLSQMSLAYRVFSRVENGRVEVVIEYWCYYVYNAFSVRVGWLPFRVSDNHPHDLERLFIVLTPTPLWSLVPALTDEAIAHVAFRIRSLIANAHDGSIPPNQYEVGDDDRLAAPFSVLVERGSHAMAPDVNNDGRFTPGIDSTVTSKLLWGIRDTGATWSRYRPSFMDDRDGSAIRVCGPAAAPPADGPDCLRYELHPADELQRSFTELQLSARERREILGTTPWLVRTFGDVRVEKLMVPADPADGRMLSRMLNRRTKTETGFVTGFTTDGSGPALILGQRYFWDVPSHHIPDVAAEAVTLIAAGGRPSIEASLWSSYNLDAITNVLLGVGWFSNARAMDIVSGTDLRLGRFRIRPTWRFRQHISNVRLTMAF